jgi:transposase InsO family protein
LPTSVSPPQSPCCVCCPVAAATRTSRSSSSATSWLSCNANSTVDGIQFQPEDRALLAALLHRLPRPTLRRLQLLVRPDTILRWHRQLLAHHHAIRSRLYRRGRPRTLRSIRLLVLRLARENPNWGYRRLHGELLTLGVKVAASTVWQILRDAGVDPSPERTSTTWASFLRSRAQALLAADFIETVTVTGAPMYILAVIDHATRRVRILGATPHPTAAWVTQAVRNLAMDLHDTATAAAAGPVMRFLIRDRDGKYPLSFDTILADSGITVIRTGVRIPRMNAVMERWGRSRPSASRSMPTVFDVPALLRWLIGGRVRAVVHPARLLGRVR